MGHCDEGLARTGPFTSRLIVPIWRPSGDVACHAERGERDRTRASRVDGGGARYLRGSTTWFGALCRAPASPASPTLESALRRPRRVASDVKTVRAPSVTRTAVRLELVLNLGAPDGERADATRDIFAERTHRRSRELTGKQIRIELRADHLDDIRALLCRDSRPGHSRDNGEPHHRGHRAVRRRRRSPSSSAARREEMRRSLVSRPGLEPGTP
jgi:hypothetical protein